MNLFYCLKKNKHKTSILYRNIRNFNFSHILNSKKLLNNKIQIRFYLTTVAKLQIKND